MMMYLGYEIVRSQRSLRNLQGQLQHMPGGRSTALLHPLRGVIHTATVTHEMAVITYDSAEHGGWGLRNGCRCGTWCGTPWIETVIIHRSRERICLDKTTSKSAISGRTDISLSWSGSVEHDQSKMHIRKGIRLNARIMRILTVLA
jgi:hypothetical protein